MTLEDMFADIERLRSRGCTVVLNTSDGPNPRNWGENHWHCGIAMPSGRHAEDLGRVLMPDDPNVHGFGFTAQEAFQVAVISTWRWFASPAECTPEVDPQ